MFNFFKNKEGTLDEKQFGQLKFNKHRHSWLESRIAQPNHPKFPYVSSLELATDHFKVIKVGDLISYWKGCSWNNTFKLINDYNWMYVACIYYSFIRIDEATDINIYADNIVWTGKEAISRLRSKPSLSAKQIDQLLKNDPVTIKGHAIINGFHRIFASIGRITQDKTYIPVLYKSI